MAHLPPKGKTRLILDLSEIGLPEVPTLGVCRTLASEQALQEHRHVGAMEICYLIRGHQVHHVGGRDYSLRGGELYVTFPDERHSTGGKPFGKGLLYWMQVRLKPGRKFLLLSPQESRPLVRKLMSMPRRRFPGVPRLQIIFESMIRESLSPPSPLRKLRVATLILEFLQQVSACSAQASAPRYSADIQRALDVMARNVREDLSVDRMADIAGLSAPQFKRKFKQQVGIPPREYLMRAKIDAAKTMLSAGRSVTEVAMELGFSSSQYFATVFKRFTFQRPSSLSHPASPAQRK